MSIKQYPGGIVTKNPTAPTTSAAKGIWTLDQATQYIKAGTWPRIPGAPTIGTATAGVASATVTYTAPSDLGTGAVTYTATSSPGGFTGTGASPITVSGLTNGTAYTFTVIAATPGGSGPSSAASNSVTPALPAIGAAYGGGYFAGQISTTANGVATHNLVVSPDAAGFITATNWGPLGVTTGFTSIIAGPTNTAGLAALAGSYPAADFCDALNTGGYTDWYLPARNELFTIYYYLKPTTTTNRTTSGANIYAVSPEPYNTTFTAGNPPQTSVVAFQSGGSEDFPANYSWSSTELSANDASAVHFGNADYYTNYPTKQEYPTGGFPGNVRAIRRVPV